MYVKRWVAFEAPQNTHVSRDVTAYHTYIIDTSTGDKYHSVNFWSYAFLTKSGWARIFLFPSITCCLAMEEPPGKRTRYSLQADVDVVLGDGAVQVRSHVLVSASEVFASMLQSNMLEASSGRIILKEKTLQGFKQVLKHLDLRGGAAPPDVTTDNVELLLQYADEYQMTGLKARCDKFLQDLCGKQAEYVLDLSNTYDLTEAKQAATRQLARVHEGPLLRYEADTTVRQTVYTELLRELSEEKFAKIKAVKPASRHWSVVLPGLICNNFQASAVRLPVLPTWP